MAAIDINTTKQVVPQCYAYTTPGISYHDGWTKIGYTERDVITRIEEQTHTADVRYKLEWNDKAVYDDGNGTFTDKEFHGYLKKLGVERNSDKEWFFILPVDAYNHFIDFRQNKGVLQSCDDPIPYKLRQEQEEAVSKTIEYFNTHTKGEFLWNAKPRFGKTLSAYDLSKKMGFRNILIVTNRPAIADSWYSDYSKFIGTKSGYYFVSHVDVLAGIPYVIDREAYTRIDDKQGCIEFVSLQDIKGSIYFGGDVDKLSELCGDKRDDGSQIGITWDILIIDEAHEGVDTYKTDIAFDHISRRHTLHLSGTPFKALANAKFKDDAIYNWTYADEQKAKRDWKIENEEENPYEILPKLNLFTYQMSEIIKDKVSEGIVLDDEVEEYAFDLNQFFSTKENGKFKYDTNVDRFLEALISQEKFPFSTDELRKKLKHTLWLLNRVDSAIALYDKLKRHPVFKEYEIILAAGDGRIDDASPRQDSLKAVQNAIKKYDKTITLSVGQLTTGVTIPEWTGVLMLCNMKSPSLYMQSAFRAQNPCLFSDDGKNFFRKENAYVFDFDPARTLTIFEAFANDLTAGTVGGSGDSDTRKRQVRELLKFFPVYGEDEEGSMIELDAEKVLTIPRKIHALEVVNRGFMSNFLFANISRIFSAPKEVHDIINQFQPFNEGKKLSNLPINDDTVDELSLNKENEVDIPDEKIIGISQDLFGERIYAKVNDKVNDVIDEVRASQGANNLSDLVDSFSKPIADTLIKVANENYGKELGKSTKRDLKNTVKRDTEEIIKKEYGNWQIDTNKIESERKEMLSNAETESEKKEINNNYDTKIQERNDKLYINITEKIKDNNFIENSGKKIVEIVETKIKNKEKDSIEDNVRGHLRGFSRTIPAFLMAYGTDNTTIETFDKIIPDNVFKEVTSISLDQFRFLRDGGKYTDNSGEEKYFEGHLFDEIVFNDSVKEFLNKRRELSNYFEQDKNIFDYIPPQKNNQIFTPKKLVVEMVDLLEEENPGCFDNPDKTFIDLYMKSGLYIAEIVKRLFNSKKIKAIYPDDLERLNHIFANQVYGLAPTEIIYQIVIHFLMDFSQNIKIDKHNIRKLDSLKSIQNGTLEKDIDVIFD